MLAGGSNTVTPKALGMKFHEVMKHKQAGVTVSPACIVCFLVLPWSCILAILWILGGGTTTIQTLAHLLGHFSCACLSEAHTLLWLGPMPSTSACVNL